MLDVWKYLLPILVADVLNPVLFAFMVYAAGGPRPVLLSSAMLAGHTAAYFSVGILLGLSLEQVLDYLQQPRPFVFALSGVIGALLLWVALRSRGDSGKRPEDRPPSLTLRSAFLTGAVVNFVGIPFALPYFAVVERLLQTDLSGWAIVLNLVAYNLLYALPFLVVPGLVLAMGQSSQPVLARINGWLEKAAAVLMPVLLGLLGLVLVIDAVSYFRTGRGLW